MRAALFLLLVLSACGSTPPVSNPDIEIGQVETSGADEPAPNRGFFASIMAQPSGGGASSGRGKADEAPPGTALPFGQVARVCSARKSDLGVEVDRQGNWRLFDTIPNSSAPRVMYVTGFDDGCAQMFTAALVLFGTATAHETVRYSMRGTYSQTDEAYETIKGRICGVRRGSACPADRIDRLESQVAFVTAYPSFGATGGPWLDLLLHDGDLAASGLNQR